jgi:hypothetical protein
MYVLYWTIIQVNPLQVNNNTIKQQYNNTSYDLFVLNRYVGMYCSEFLEILTTYIRSDSLDTERHCSPGHTSYYYRIQCTYNAVLKPRSWAGWPDWANFRLLSKTLLGAVFWKHTQVAQKFISTFSTVKVVHKFWPKMVWATFWVIFSQTHLVTLVSTIVAE